MSNVTNISDHRLSVENKPLQSDGGDGTYNGMEARVARLESDVDYIKRDIGEIKTSIRNLEKTTADTKILLATVQEKIEHLPSKGFIVAVTGTTITIIVGLLTILARLGILHST